MIGQKISPILGEIENTLWEFEANKAYKAEYTVEGFRAAVKLFMSAMLDKMWEHQESLEMPQEDRILMAERLGSEIRAVIMAYTGIDSHKLYE